MPSEVRAGNIVSELQQREPVALKTVIQPPIVLNKDVKDDLGESLLSNSVELNATILATNAANAGQPQKDTATLQAKETVIVSGAVNTADQQSLLNRQTLTETNETQQDAVSKAGDNDNEQATK